MLNILIYLVLFLALAGAAYAAYLFLNGELTTAQITGRFFGPRPERRLDVVEHASVDGKRRLILIRRDEVEHLIMTGGPVDVVIETGIGSKPQPAARDEPAVYNRAARTFGGVTAARAVNGGGEG